MRQLWFSSSHRILLLVHRAFSTVIQIAFDTMEKKNHVNETVTAKYEREILGFIQLIVFMLWWFTFDDCIVCENNTRIDSLHTFKIYLFIYYFFLLVFTALLLAYPERGKTIWIGTKCDKLRCEINLKYAFPITSNYHVIYSVAVTYTE